MRIDKFLWAVRVFKTRSEAADACRLGRIRIGDDVVKAAKEVKQGDIVHVRRNGIEWSYKILDILSNRVGAALVPQYIEDVTAEEEREKWLLRKTPSFEKRDRGSGRPTKRERREIDKFKDGEDFF